MPRPKPRFQDNVARASGQTLIRWFFYFGFATCSVSMVALLGLGGAWWAPMLGTVAFGIPTIIAYLTEQEHQQNREVRLENRRMRDGGQGDWDLDDDEDGDPTVPPTYTRN
jgi:hypothetical protein